MSDRKHIEYCIKLGNTFVQDENVNRPNEYYTQPRNNNYENINRNSNDFKSRLQNWNS